MSKRRVIARVVEAGECRYYEKGRSFVLTGFTPKGLCDSAYAALSRDAQTLRYGGALPWQEGGRVLTRCPDPKGALWELVQEGGGAGRDEERPPCEKPQAKTQTETFSVDVCQAAAKECQHALCALADVQTRVRAAIEESGWSEYLMGRLSRPPLAHQRLRVAISGCPNGCSQPHIRDIGIVAQVRPTAVLEACTACGQCAEVCDEAAIGVADEEAAIDQARCVGCGACIDACPAEAIETEGLRFQILVGGKLGRRPRLAQPLPGVVTAEQLPQVVQGIVLWIMAHLGPDDRIGAMIEREGIEGLCREAFAGRQPNP